MVKQPEKLDQLCSFVKRYEHIHDKIAALSDEVKAVNAEAEAVGFSVSMPEDFNQVVPLWNILRWEAQYQMLRLHNESYKLAALHAKGEQP